EHAGAACGLLSVVVGDGVGERNRTPSTESGGQRRTSQSDGVQTIAGRAEPSLFGALAGGAERSRAGQHCGSAPTAAAAGPSSRGTDVRIATLANASVIHTQRWVEYFRSRGHEVAVWSLEPGPPALGARIL